MDRIYYYISWLFQCQDPCTQCRFLRLQFITHSVFLALEIEWWLYLTPRCLKSHDICHIMSETLILDCPATGKMDTSQYLIFQVLSICHVLLNVSFTPCMHAKSLQLCSTLCDPIDHSPPSFSVHRISRQEYWSGLPCPPPGGLPDPVIEPVTLTSPALVGRFFTTSTTQEAPPLFYPHPNWARDTWRCITKVFAWKQKISVPRQI